MEEVFHLAARPFCQTRIPESRSNSPDLRFSMNHYFSLCADAMSHHHNISSEPAQTIEGEHLDPQKLYRLLERVYGPDDNENTFRVEVSSLLATIFFSRH